MDEVEFLSSPTKAQMDLVTMMMEMENLNELSKAPLQPSVGYSGVHSPAFTSSHAHAPSSLLAGAPSSPLGGPHQDGLLSTPTLSNSPFGGGGPPPSQRESVAAMREMIFRIAAMQPIRIDPESVRPPKRRNVKISKDPQSVAARHRRERISERIRILQQLVPGGTKMDTASMLDEAIHYMKFLKDQVQSLERAATAANGTEGFSTGLNYSCYDKGYGALGREHFL